MRLLLVPFGFIAGALAGSMAEIGIVSIIERWRAARIEVPLLLAPLLPAAIGICGAILLLAIVRRTCGPAPSPLSLFNALATVVVIVLAMLGALFLAANPFDANPPVLYYACLLGPLATMLVGWSVVRRRAR